MVQTNNISKKVLTGDNIGIYFGTFAPLHAGHQQDIYTAATKNDGVVLIVSGYKDDRGDKIGLDLNKRFRYLREAFNDEENIFVSSLNEDDIPKYPNGWTQWVNKLKAIVEKSVSKGENHNFTIYVGEQDYVTMLNKLIPEWKVEYINRDNIPISATMIRNDPEKYFNVINRVFRRHFTKRILLAGSASTGKSTLVRRLARSVNAPFSEEYARLYEEKYNITDNELDVTDYYHFISGQYDANENEVNSPANQGLVVFDTDAIVTRVYAKLYLPKEDQEKLEPLFQEIIKKEKIDKIFVIPPITKYVDDGFRAMEWEGSRYEYHDELMKQLDEFGLMDKVVLLDDTDEFGGFNARYLHALKETSKITSLEIPK